jgi:hypothetical protein
VRDSKITMLVNVPRFVKAASYTFVRVEGEENVPLGTCSGEQVYTLAGERR